jgi:spore coat protein CotF
METFANFFAIRNDPAAWAICQRRFPQLSQVFDDLIKEALGI